MGSCRKDLRMEGRGEEKKEKDLEHYRYRY